MQSINKLVKWNVLDVLAANMRIIINCPASLLLKLSQRIQGNSNALENNCVNFNRRTER